VSTLDSKEIKKLGTIFLSKTKILKFNFSILYWHLWIKLAPGLRESNSVRLLVKDAEVQNAGTGQERNSSKGDWRRTGQLKFYVLQNYSHCQVVQNHY
jgi:hypothetical protein